MSPPPPNKGLLPPCSFLWRGRAWNARNALPSAGDSLPPSPSSPGPSPLTQPDLLLSPVSWASQHFCQPRKSPCQVSLAQSSPGRWSWVCLCLSLARWRPLLQFGARLWWRLAEAGVLTHSEENGSSPGSGSHSTPAGHSIR